MNLLRVFALAVSLPLLPAVVCAKAAVDMSAAPLDEYFGSQKMSALGIRMRIDDLGRRYHAHMLSDPDALHDATILEDSYRAWDRKYPRDRWLAPTALHLEQLYAEVQLPEARTHATAMLHFIATTFAATSYGHLSRLRLAQGFPPLGAQNTVTATPGAVASAAPDAASPAASASDMPSAGPSTQPSSAASSTPSP